MKTWYTADTHFGHANIIKYASRPFKNIKRMEEVLVKNWNSRVGKNDIVIFLGDFMFKQKEKAKYLVDQLNGNITFIKGNHDNNNSLNTQILSLVVKQANQEFFCIHRPEDYCNSYHFNLVAHVHDKWKIRKIYHTILVNVGVDVWNYHPVDINEIIKAVNSFKKTSRLHPRK